MIDTRPGRSCPPAYGYSPSIFARPAEIVADTLYVIGGLYGNHAALDCIEQLAQRETVAPARVFNGDFHWFDADSEAFAAIDRAVMRHHALRGNVETELAGDDDSNGCGCAYPEAVPDADVERSNAILERLRGAARCVAGARAALAALPAHVVAQVGGARIAIVHGDAWSLAGWRFAHDALHDAGREASLAAAFEQAAVNGFASTHTCLPALKVVATPLGDRFVINNGAAGMPNFRQPRCGLISRISTRPLPAALRSERLYGAGVDGVYVDALAVHYDQTQLQRAFAGLWPEGSAAQVSYGRRIAEGPPHTIDDALGRSTALSCAALE